MGLYLLFGVYAVLGAAGFAFLWRRSERQRSEIEHLREMLAARSAPAPKMRATADGAVVSISELASHRVERAGAVAAAKPARHTRNRSAVSLSPETARALTLAVLAAAPAAGLFVYGAAAAVVASGLAIAAAMMVIALRPIWRVAAWAGVITGAVWAALGFALDAAFIDPISFSICLALAGVCGVFHAFSRGALPGATMALITAAAALALGSTEIGLFHAPGAAYAAIVAAAAIAGAMSLKLDSMHLAAFGAAVIGLFVLSGQQSAAIWFTPAAAWTGALFFAIAVVRVPQLGARGVAIAGTGAFAPLGVITALHAAGHGLASPAAAAGVFFGFAVLLSGVIALTAMRRETGLASMRLTLWVLSTGVFAAFAAAVSLGIPGPPASAAYAALALGLSALDARVTSRAWRVCAVFALFAALASALLSARALLDETSTWNPWLGALTGLLAPALLTGAGAYLFERNGASRVAAAAEAASALLSLAAAHILLRLIFSGGAPLLQPVTFVEASAHSSVWLAASLAIAARMSHGAVTLRAFAMRWLAIGALVGLLVTIALWLFAVWPDSPRGAWFGRTSLGLVLPAVLLMAHWIFWRWRRVENRARVAFMTAAAALATFAVLELFALDAAPTWAKTLGAAVAIALALGGNFAPGVTANGERLRLREKSPSQSAPQAVR